MENSQQHYPFPLLPLPYEYDALEPNIDTLTMQLHHDRHLQTYVNELNAALADYPEYHSWPLERLILNANWLPEVIRTPVKHSAGGVYNHNFFFGNLSPASPGEPSGDLADRINRAFGSFVTFKGRFKAAATGVFGSGYAWLAVDPKGGLRIVTTANQDTPLTLGACPLLTVDVWEHAYYLKHYNLRADYIDSWANVANWNDAAEHLAACLKNRG